MLWNTPGKGYLPVRISIVKREKKYDLWVIA